MSVDIEKQSELLMSDTPLPAVSVDTRLGEKFKRVDFDYDAYQSMVKLMTGDQSPLADLNILIGKKNILSGGLYYRNHIKTETYRTVNNSLAHETQHHLDDANGVLHSLKPALAMRAHYMLGAGAAGLTAANVAIFMSERGYDPNFQKANLLGAALGLGSLAAKAVYSGSEAEVRARKSGARFAKLPIIQLERK
jgi:hypothetical protein